MDWRPPTELPDLTREPVLSFDLETYDPELNERGPGWARGKGHIVGLSVATRDNRAWYMPIKHEVQPELNMDPDQVMRWFKYHMELKMPKVGANITYDVGWCREEGIKVNGQLYDPQFAEALLNEKSRVSLDALGTKYLGVGKSVDLLRDWCLNYYGGSPSRWRSNIYRAPVTLTGHYGEQDALLPLQVLKKQWPLLYDQGLMKLFHIECGLINLLVDMRFAGVSIDVPYVEQLHQEVDTERTLLQSELSTEVGMDVNVNAAASLALAYDKLGLTYTRTAPTKNHPQGQPSFTAEQLEKCPHPFAAKVLQVKKLAKLQSTFLEGYLLNSHVNGKVYGNFHPLMGTEGGAKTGRFASSLPNLQNIPTRSELGKRIRRAFIGDKGHFSWRKYDYSQIEYRLLAHFAIGEGAEAIRLAYQSDPRTDYHESTAALIKKVTGVDLGRSKTKNINFGLAYGMGIAKLAKDLGVSVAEAKVLSAAYHEGVPFVSETMEQLSDSANQLGYNLTILGRRTRFDTWESATTRGTPALPYEQAVANYGHVKRAYLYRTLNYTLQGSSADMMKAAMVACYQDGIFDVTGVPRLTVHDELDFSVQDHSARTLEAFKAMHHKMQTVMPLKVPVICDLEEGPNWGDVKEVSLLGA